MSREKELGMGEASVEATNERLAGMDFSFNFSAAPAKTTDQKKDEPKKEEPTKLAGGFSNFSFGGSSAPAAAPAAKKEEPKPAAAKSVVSSSGGGGGGGGGFSNFSFGGGGNEPAPKKTSITRGDGKRSSLYNPEKGSREEELGLAGASIETTNANLNAMDFSFNFEATEAKAAAVKTAAATAAGGSSREEELGMGKASVEDTTARLSSMSFSFGPEREAAEKKAKEEEEAKKQKVIDAEVAAAAQKKEDEEAAAAAVKYAKEQAESNPTFIYENVTPEWVTKVAEAQAVLGKGLSDEHPDRIAASALTMQEAGRMEGMIAAMDWDEDEGLPAPAPPKETPWAPGAVIAAQKAAAAITPQQTEEEQAAEQATAVAAARAKIHAPEVEDEVKPDTNYTEIYETVTLQWSKKLAEAQATLTKGLPDQHPEVIAARVIALAESDRITGMVDAMDAEDEDRVPVPPAWTPWAPETAVGYQGTPPDFAQLAAASRKSSSASAQAAPEPTPAPATEPAAPAAAEENFDDFGDFNEKDESAAMYDNTDDYNNSSVYASAADPAADVPADVPAAAPAAAEEEDGGDGGDGGGFDSEPVEEGTAGNNPWGADMDEEEEEDEGYNLVGDAPDVEDVDNGAAAAAAAAADAEAAAAKEAAAVEEAAAEAAAAAAAREAEIAAESGGEPEVETFLKDLSKDVHKRVWPLLSAEEINDMATLGDMSKADLKGMGIKMGDASKIVRAAANWGC